MADISWGDWRRPGEVLGNSLRDVGQAAIDAYCNLYRNYPAWTGGSLFQLVGLDPGRALFDRVCDEPPPPTPTQPPMLGGQCCADYIFHFEGQQGGNPFATDFIVKGKVGTPRYRRRDTEDGFYNPAIFLDVGIDCPPTFPETKIFALGQNLNDGMGSGITGLVYNISRVDGQPDTCGDLPPEYPDIIPRPDELNYDIDITVGDIAISVPVTIPITQFSPTFNFSPSFAVNVGGVRVTLDIGGLSFTFNPTVNLPSLPTGEDPRPPADRPVPVTPPSPGGGGGDCPDVNLQPVLNAIATVKADTELILEKLEELLNCDRCRRQEITSLDYAVQAYGAAQSAVISLDPKSRWVRLEIVSQPINPRVQSGEVAKDVYFAGWYYFQTGGSAGDRNPIHFLDNAYPTIEGARTFAYTLPKGYAGIVYDVYEVEQP